MKKHMSAKAFLIEGFPRNKEQIEAFNKCVSKKDRKPKIISFYSSLLDTFLCDCVFLQEEGGGMGGSNKI